MTIELDFGQPQISAEQEKWQGRAIKLAGSEKSDMVTVNNQVWNKSVADKCGARYNFVAKYSVTDSVGDGVECGDKDGVK